MSKELQTQFYEIVYKIKSCLPEEIKIKYLPNVNKTFIVSNPEMPKYLTHKSRLCAAIFGVGLYYDEYSKSIPFISYRPKINLDVDSSFDLNKLWAKKWCRIYGKCSINNKKPKPNIDDL